MIQPLPLETTGPWRRPSSSAAVALHLSHAIRLATLRRLTADGLPPVRRLAYYRQVLDYLNPEELEAGYVDYIAARYQLAVSLSARSDRQNRALPDRR